MDIEKINKKYHIGKDGIIRNVSTGRVLKGAVSDYGYIRYSMFKKNIKAHRLVAILYIPNPNNYPQINHINGIKTDNRVENLEWCTCQNNIDHAISIGLARNKFKKLNTNSVLEIRELYFNGVTQSHLSRMFGVCPKTIRQVINRQTYKYIF